MKPTMFLFTTKFPYDKGEEFLETELPILSNFFNIVVVPRITKGKLRFLPNNIKVDNFFSNYNKYTKILLYGLTQTSDVFKEIFSVKKIPAVTSIFYFGWSRIVKKWFKQYKNLKSPVVFYSYWFSLSAFALSELNKHVNFENLVISRAHRGDLYEFRHKYNYIPLRKEILKNIDRVFCISEDGRTYLSTKYPEYKCKIELSRLGVTAQDTLNKRSNEKENIFRIVTCSYLVPVKRIGLLIDALYYLSKKEFKKKIIWHHIGGGPLEKELKRQTKKLNVTSIECHFIGYLKNDEVKKYYRENPVDLFLNVSESEGLPVSIMEALSFGIPVMATNTGGTSELVDESVGKLIPVYISSQKLADYIYDFVNLSNDIINQKRINALKKWNEKVNATKNYENFAKRILALLEKKHFK